MRGAETGASLPRLRCRAVDPWRWPGRATRRAAGGRRWTTCGVFGTVGADGGRRPGNQPDNGMGNGTPLPAGRQRSRATGPVPTRGPDGLGCRQERPPRAECEPCAKSLCAPWRRLFGASAKSPPRRGTQGTSKRHLARNGATGEAASRGCPARCGQVPWAPGTWRSPYPRSSVRHATHRGTFRSP